MCMRTCSQEMGKLSCANTNDELEFVSVTMSLAGNFCLSIALWLGIACKVAVLHIIISLSFLHIILAIKVILFRVKMGGGLYEGLS